MSTEIDRLRGKLESAELASEVVRAPDGNISVVAHSNRTAADRAMTLVLPVLEHLRAERDALKAAIEGAAEALQAAHRIMATSSHDWSQHPSDAWLYALLVGWDCELPEHANGEHDPVDCSGPNHLEDFAERFGWTEGGVAKIRAQRRALAALDTPSTTETSDQPTPERRRELLREMTQQAVEAGLYGEPAPETRPAPESPDGDE